MWGRATLAMEVSSTSIKAASATVAAISQGFVFGFHAYMAAFAAEAPAVVVEAIVLRFPQDLAAWPYILLIDAERDRGDAISGPGTPFLRRIRDEGSEMAIEKRERSGHGFLGCF